MKLETPEFWDLVLSMILDNHLLVSGFKDE